MDQIHFSSFVKSRQSASAKWRQQQRHRLATKVKRVDYSALTTKAKRALSGRLTGLKSSRLGLGTSLPSRGLSHKELFSLKYFSGNDSFFANKSQGQGFFGAVLESAKNGFSAATGGASRLAFDPCESCGGRIDAPGYLYCSRCRSSDSGEGSLSRLFNFLAQGGTTYKSHFGLGGRKRDLPALALRRGQCYLWLKYRRFKRSYINDLDTYCRRIASDAKNIKIRNMTLQNMFKPLANYFKPFNKTTDSDDEIESVICDDDDEEEGKDDDKHKNRRMTQARARRVAAGGSKDKSDDDDDDLEIISGPSQPDSIQSSSEQSSQPGISFISRRHSLNSLLKFMSLRRGSPQTAKVCNILRAHHTKHEQLESRLKLIPESQPVSVLPQEHEPDYDVWGLRKAKPFDADLDAYTYIDVLFKNKSHKYNSFDLIHDFAGIASFMNVGYEEDVVTEQFGITITRSTLECLCGSNWLNDEVINYYMSMIQKRNDYFVANKVENVPNCYCFNTFFFSALCGFDKPQVEYNYKAVSRWTLRKKINVFEKDILLIPVHLNKIHWVLGVVDMRPKWRRILLFDSLGGTCPLWFNNIKQWLQDEHMDKQKTPLDIDEWECCIIVDSEDIHIPRQENGHDCGVFICLYAECVAAARRFDFTQTDIAIFRIKMIKQIIDGSIYDAPPDKTANGGH